MAYSKQNFQDGQILNAANLEKMENGIIAGQGAHNLLDNSDFRIKNNIINTKGLLDYSFDSGDVFDRWRLHWTGDGRVSIKDGYIELYRETYCTYLFQHPRNLQSMVGKTYTVAAKARYNGRIGWIDSTQRVDCGPLAFNDWDIATCTFTVGSATSDIGEAGIEISSRSNLSFEVQWVALYEGAYTKETLPAYLTKGKHVEMLNCNIPLAPHNLLDNSDFRNPVNQRGIQSGASITEYTYCLDRWMNFDTTAGTLTLSENGISFTMTNFNQRLPETIKTGTVVTAAAKWNDGTIVTVTGAITRGNEWTWFTAANNEHQIGVIDMGNNKEAHFTILGGSGVVEWAALYEGSYDASTLPAYQPKGYAAELAECQRQYFPVFQSETTYAYWTKADGDTCKIYIPSPKMRVNPTPILYDGGCTVYLAGNSTWSNAVTLQYYGYAQGCNVFSFASPSSYFEIGKTYLYRGIKALSADL